MGEAMGQHLCFGSRDVPQAPHPSPSVFEVLDVHWHAAEVLKPVPVGNDVALTITATPGTHRAAFVTQFVTQTAGPPALVLPLGLGVFWASQPWIGRNLENNFTSTP